MGTTVVWQKGRKITYKKYPYIFLTYEYADQIGKEKGYGETVVIRFRTSFQRQLLTFVNDLVSGIRYKFPVCCVLNFCIDNLLGRPSAQLRWGDNTVHIECFVHAKTHTKKAIPLNLY
jgi:hypothetical protein